jgi:glucosyltransferase Lgt1/2/3
MTNRDQYLDFHKTTPQETHAGVIKRLRTELKSQLGFVKWLFFRKNYYEVKKILAKDDDQFISYMMRVERSLYLKSIVICTTGPISVGKILFGNYVMSSDEINRSVRPYTFSHYGLQQGFLSRNVIPLHENPLRMLKYLGADVGELNDSSWLDEGISLQQKRAMVLLEKQRHLKAELPTTLMHLEKKIVEQVVRLQKESNGLFGFFGPSARRDAKIEALQAILRCFHSESKTFDVAGLKDILSNNSFNWKQVFAGFFSRRTKNIIDELSLLCHNAVLLRVTIDKKLLFSLPKDDTAVGGKIFGEAGAVKKPAVIAHSGSPNMVPSKVHQSPVSFFSSSSRKGSMNNMPVNIHEPAIIPSHA